MKQLYTKEHLAYFMQCGMMRLSNYDLKFVQNLHHLATQQKPITTNQIALFDKLVGKYSRQLTKQGFSIETLNQLPWTTPIIQSDPAFTDAFISIDDNKIIFKAPFNKKFIQDFRKLSYNPFEWKRESKRYEAEFGTLTLRLLIKTVHEHYPIVNYCPIICHLLNTLHQFNDVKHWSPTLVKVNDNYIISSINEHVYSAIEHISLDDDISTISELSEFGISIDDSVIQDTAKLKFASNFVTEIEVSNIESVINYLQELKCDCIYYAGNIGVFLNRDIRNKISAIIPNQFNLNDMSYNKQAHQFKYPVVFQFSSTVSNAKIQTHNIKKIIKIKNSNPIDIK